MKCYDDKGWGVSERNLFELIVSIEDIIWEWDQGSISPYELVDKLKETIKK